VATQINGWRLIPEKNMLVPKQFQNLDLITPSPSPTTRKISPIMVVGHQNIAYNRAGRRAPKKFSPVAQGKMKVT
jgi:hypothetical protein